MSTSSRGRSPIVVLSSVVVGLILVGGSIVLLGEGDGILGGRGGEPSMAPTADRTAAVVPTPGASSTASPSPAVTPSPSPPPRVGARFTDVASLVPERVAGFRQIRNRSAAPLRRQSQALQARRVRYANRRGAEVTHLVALYPGQRPAGAALREWRSRLLDRRGARVVDDTGLEDSRGVRRGRLLEVRRRGGDLVVLWRNRNLVGVLGPGRQRLHRRLYEAWPY